MRVEYTLSTEEVLELLAEGLRRRNIIRRKETANVSFYSGGQRIGNVIATISVNTTLPKEALEEEVPVKGKKPGEPRSALERLTGDENE